MLKVIGAGFGRTGTHSLAEALDRLGLGPCYTLLEVDRNPRHLAWWGKAMQGEGVDWKALFAGYESAVEWPTVAFLPSILAAFPQAKVVLTLREPKSWYASAAATIFPGLEASAQHPDPDKRARSGMKRKLILERTFQGRHWDQDFALSVYQNHIDTVLDLVPAPRLLQYKIGAGWAPLCAFLGKEAPKLPFPRRNQRADFLASAPSWARALMQRSQGESKD